MALEGASNQTSETALAVLAFTTVAGTERDPGVRVDDPIGSRLIGWSDGKYRVVRMRVVHPLFRRMVEQSDPGAYGFMVARLHHMDDVVRQEVTDGIDQLVILGAGYDTRAYRMRDELSGVRVFEVDLPAMSRDKRARLKKATGAVPLDATYVEVDFNDEDLLEQLSRQSYDPAGRTLFVLSGVSMYLPEAAVLKLFSQVATQRAPGTSILFDYFFSDLMTHPDRYYGGREWIRRATDAGEEPRYGIAMDQVAALLADMGLQLESQYDMAELADRHLRRSDGSLVARPYEFAAVAHAVVEDKTSPVP